MNARDNIKPKSIRVAILQALADGAITTIDDLQIKMDEKREKIANNVYPAAAEDLIKRMRDDVTGGAAYQILPKGRELLAKYASGKFEAPADVVEAVAVEKPVITPGVKVDPLPAGHAQALLAQKDEEIARTNRMFVAACADLGFINEHLRLDPNDGGADPIIGAIEDIEERLALAESRLSQIDLMLRNSSAEALESGSTTEMILAAVLHKSAHQHDPVGYVIQRPAKPLVRFTKAISAETRAMAFARTGQRAQVFALHLVGTAVPGSEWRKA